MKFIITEEEKNRIRGLYEYVDESDTFLDQFARLYGVTSEDASKINFSSGQTSTDIYKNIILGPLQYQTFHISRETGTFDKVLEQLVSFYKGEIGLKGSVSEEQKLWLYDFTKTLSSAKIMLETQIQRLSQEEFQKLMGQPTSDNKIVQDKTQDLVSPEEKINTTNDRTYDYKLSGGKYYYSLKGQNNWVEANGKGLESIKTKVTFS
jgi:hypothetical protein